MNEILMSEEQRMWAITQRLLAQMIERNMAEPIEPENAIRMACFKVRRTKSLKDKKEEGALRRVLLKLLFHVAVSE